jgi:chloramphenicol 3-O phosphotransferase
MPSKIVILNGISSSGKTSLAKALQENTQQLYLRVAIDDFYALLPDWFRHSRSERWPEVNLQLQEALFKTVAILAGQGHNVIVDTVLIDP